MYVYFIVFIIIYVYIIQDGRVCMCFVNVCHVYVLSVCVGVVIKSVCE